MSAMTISPSSSVSQNLLCLTIDWSEIAPLYNLDRNVIPPDGIIPTRSLKVFGWLYDDQVALCAAGRNAFSTYISVQSIITLILG